MQNYKILTTNNFQILAFMFSYTLDTLLLITKNILFTFFHIAQPFA